MTKRALRGRPRPRRRTTPLIVEAVFGRRVRPGEAELSQTLHRRSGKPPRRAARAPEPALERAPTEVRAGVPPEGRVPEAAAERASGPREPAPPATEASRERGPARLREAGARASPSRRGGQAARRG